MSKCSCVKLCFLRNTTKICVCFDIIGKVPVCLLETSVPVAILLYEIHLYVTFVLSLVLVAQHWGAGDKELVLRYDKFIFPFAMLCK